MSCEDSEDSGRMLIVQNGRTGRRVGVEAFSWRTRRVGFAEGIGARPVEPVPSGGGAGVGARGLATLQGGMDGPQLWLEGQGRSLGIWPCRTFQLGRCAVWARRAARAEASRAA